MPVSLSSHDHVIPSGPTLTAFITGGSNGILQVGAAGGFVELPANVGGFPQFSVHGARVGIALGVASGVGVGVNVGVGDSVGVIQLSLKAPFSTYQNIRCRRWGARWGGSH